MPSLSSQSFRDLLRTLGFRPGPSSAELRARVRRTRVAMLRWKGKCHGSARRIRELQRQVAQLEAALRVSEQARLRRFEEIERLLAEARRAFQDNRHQADAIKVQLDLVDGAVSTLDRRYRMLTPRGVGADM